MLSKFSISRTFQPWCTSGVHVDVSGCFLCAFQCCQMCECGKSHYFIETTSAQYLEYLFLSVGERMDRKRYFFLLFYIFFTTKESLMFQSVLKLPQMVSVSNSLYFREWRRQVVFQRIQYFHKVNIEVMMKNTKISAGTQIIQLFHISVKNCPSVKQLSSPQLSLQIHITQRPEPTI